MAFPMIRGVDAGAILDAVRAGREERYRDDQRQAAIRQQQQIQDLQGQLFIPGSRDTSVAGQYAPNTPTQSSSTPAQSSSTPALQPSMEDKFDEVFSQRMPGPSAVASNYLGESLPAQTLGPVSSMYQTGAQPRQAPPQVNEQVLMQIVGINPEYGGNLATALKSMSARQLEQQARNASQMGAAAYHLRTQAKTPEERRRLAPDIIQNLKAMGIRVPQQINLSDNGLMAIEALAMTLDERVDNQRMQNEQAMGRSYPVVSGGSVVRERPIYDAQGNFVGYKSSYNVGGERSEEITVTDPETGIEYFKKDGDWFKVDGEGDNAADLNAWKTLPPWEETEGKGAPSVLTSDQYNAIVQALGKEQADAWMALHGIQLRGGE